MYQYDQCESCVFRFLLVGCNSRIDVCFFFFFFQAEDGIRDKLVTGVQTCALPIWVVVLSLVGILYGGLVAMVQPDFKKLIAYSSVAHLGFVTLGIWALTLQSVQGALLVMINHGISTGALFFLVGMIYERRHSRLIAAYGGIARVVPLFAAILTFVSLSSIGLPGTNGFVG